MLPTFNEKVINVNPITWLNVKTLSLGPCIAPPNYSFTKCKEIYIWVLCGMFSPMENKLFYPLKGRVFYVTSFKNYR
jgi:hypothetical protein